METDKLYVILIIGMIGIFIYWYQTRLDQEANAEHNQTVYCAGCKRKMIKRKDKHRSRESEHGHEHDRRANRPKGSKQSKQTKRLKRKSKSPKRDRNQRRTDSDSQSDDTIPDSIIESRLRQKRDGRNTQARDDESEISIESLDTIDRSEMSGSKRDDDTLDMVDGTIDSDADTIDLD